MRSNSATWAAVLAAFVVGMGCASSPPRVDGPVQVSPVCSAIGRADAHSVLLRRDNIVSVAPLSERLGHVHRNPLARMQEESKAKRVGVRVVLKPAPGLTGEWLQTLANCDRNLPPEEHAVAFQCPFELANTKAEVRSLGDSFAIDVTSSDPAIIDEATRRAEALAAR